MVFRKGTHRPNNKSKPKHSLSNGELVPVHQMTPKGTKFYLKARKMKKNGVSDSLCDIIKDLKNKKKRSEFESMCLPR